MPTSPKILLAPLNWGLGHATRCLPVAAALREAGAEVHWASDGAALALLKHERPQDTIHELPHVEVRYPTRSALLNMVLAGPALMRSWRRDSSAVRALQRQHDFDAVVSDNRLGCRVAGLPCAILTHQVHLPVAGLAGTAGNWLNHRMLRRFDEVVVPDVPGPERLAGPMSKPLAQHPTTYIGPVSRFEARGEYRGQAAAFQHTGSYAFVAVLSGPEPTRTQLEGRVLEQLLAGFAGMDEPAAYCIVRGLPGAASVTPLVAQARAAGFVVSDFMPAAELGQVLAKARTILARPGYTTVMDLAALGRRAIYVPTPGQPEQAWLGASLARQGRGLCVAQSRLVLAEAVTALEVCVDSQPMRTTERLTSWASAFIGRV